MDTLVQPMISGGVATVFVRDMDRAVSFYTEALGLKLVYRAGNHWAQVDVGNGFGIGLHPASDSGSNPPGVNGGVQIGLNVTQPIEDVVRQLESRGVVMNGPIRDDDGAVKLAFFSDPDGNEIYLCESRH